MSYYGFRPYVPVAQRRLQALREMDKLRKKGRVVSPVVIEGRAITRNFWGKAWCDNLERYSDYANRLPRGRTYVRNGSVVDLQIERGQVRATVSGSDIYSVTIAIATLPPAHWRAICTDCLGSVGSLVELLQGRLTKNVMERVCRAQDGLFPGPHEIKMSCSCPDWADMCKHVAAVMYGAGARLDVAPDLLFTLRGVDRTELIAEAGADLPLTRKGGGSARVLASDDVAALFGIEMATAPSTTGTREPQKDALPAKAAAGRPKQSAASKTTAFRRLAKSDKTPRRAGPLKAGSAVTAATNGVEQTPTRAVPQRFGTDAERHGAAASDDRASPKPSKRSRRSVDPSDAQAKQNAGAARTGKSAEKRRGKSGVVDRRRLGPAAVAKQP